MDAVKKKHLEEDVEKIGKGEDKESYASEFVDSVFLDEEDFGIRLEPRSHKENPEIVDDDDEEEEKKDDKKDDDNDDHDDHALVRNKATGSSEVRNEKMQTPIPSPLRSSRINLSSDKTISQELIDTISPTPATTSQDQSKEKRISSKHKHIPGALHMICRRQAGSKNRPPMFIRRTMFHGRLVFFGDPNREVHVNETFHVKTDDELTKKELKQIEADDQAIQTIFLGLPEDIYAAIDSCETTQEIWLRVQQIMKGSNIGIQEKKAKLFNEWERFTSTDGESIESYYHRFLKRMIPEPDDLNREVPVNETFHVQTDDELTKKELKHIEANDQAIQTILLGNANQIPNGNGNLVAARTEGNATGNNGNQIRCYNCRGVGIQLQAEEFDLMAAAADLDEIEEVNANYGSTEVHNYDNCYDNEIFNMFTQEEQYTELLKPIPEPHQVPQNDNNVISKVSSVEQSGGTVEQHPVNVEETQGSRQVTIVHQTKDLHTADYTQLYDFLKYNKKEIAQPGMNMGQDRQMQMVGGNGGNQFRQYTGQNTGNPDGYNDVIGNQNQIGNGNLVAARAKGNATRQNGNQIRCYNCRGVDGSAKVHENCDDNEIFNMFTQEEQCTEILEPIPESHQVPQNDNNVISEDTNVEQGGETVEQHPANFKETRTLYESLYQNLAIEVEKVNSVNRKLKETNADLTTKLARFKNQTRMTIETHNWSSSAHQELHKIVREEIFLIVNQVDARVLNFEIQFLKEAAKFVRDFKSLANEADASLAMHKALELEIERLLKAVVSQDIMTIVQKESVVDTSDLQTELEPYKDMQQKIKRLQAQLGDLKGKSKDTSGVSDTRNSLSQKLENENVELEFQVFDQKENTQDASENTEFAKQPIVENLPKVGETNALSKPVTLNSISTPQESKAVNNDKVIASGMFRINTDKTSRKEKKVPNLVRASNRTKPITVSQPRVFIKKDVNSDLNGLSSTGVDNTKTRRP
nr:hypothetical protein [Tanacetum cinerariifolium]